jgi:peptide deformylase
MILDITTFDHPALRTPGTRIEKIDARIRDLANDMIETMRDADGLGLAAQQVGLPLQMFVLDVPQMPKRPSAMRLDGQPADFESLMPMVLLNAEVETFGKTVTEGEGCLSFPEVAADVARPLSVRVKAQILDGSTIAFEADGLLARAIQHELDHTKGILFIDRANPETRAEFDPSIRHLARPAA